MNATEGYGRWIWVEARPIRDDSGAVDRVAGFARDVTEHKRRERELQRSEQRYQRLLETSPSPIFIYATGPECELVYANRAAVEFLAAEDADELLGTKAGVFTHPDHRADVDRRRARLVEARESVPPVEQKLLDTDGNTKYAIMASAPVVYEGEPAIQTVATDITTQKRREYELKRQHERLDSFASVLSHDLRNPLNVASGNLELVREECESDHLDDIAGAHERMYELIEDLLVLARDGNPVERRDAVDLADLVESCWRTVETNDATLRMATESSVRADASRLRQLFENLIRNAVEHGGDAVTITVGDLHDSSGFYVADDGPGIPESEREAVFETGYTTSHGGSGMGLAIVAEIAAAHGWAVEVTESDDGGARFEITTSDGSDA